MPREIISNSFIQCGIGERSIINYHSILKDIFLTGKKPETGEIIVEDDVIENDNLVEKDLIFIDSCCENNPGRSHFV